MTDESSERFPGKGKYPVLDPDGFTRMDLVKTIDYTLLKPEQGARGYLDFLKTAGEWGFKGVFIPPCYVQRAVEVLSGSEVVVGTPVSFPFGYASYKVKAEEAVAALNDGARELDVVMNISAAVSGAWETVEDDLRSVANAVREWEKEKKGPYVVLKVILETPYLGRDQKLEACNRARAAGFDYVKTATGLGPGGATPEDVELMRGVVGDEMGVKAAGGIRTWSDARRMIAAGACRIGTSTGPELVEDFLRAKGS